MDDDSRLEAMAAMPAAYSLDMHPDIADTKKQQNANIPQVAVDDAYVTMSCCAEWPFCVHGNFDLPFDLVESIPPPAPAPPQYSAQGYATSQTTPRATLPTNLDDGFKSLGIRDEAEKTPMRNDRVIPVWQGQHTGGQRLHQPQTPPPLGYGSPLFVPSFLATMPSGQSASMKDDCSDFVHRGPRWITLNVAPVQQRWKSELIYKVEVDRYIVQTSLPRDALTALHVSLSAVRRSMGLVPPLKPVIANLFARYKVDEYLCAAALFQVLEAYGSVNGGVYALGIVNGGCPDPNHYDIRVQHAEAADPRRVVTVWLFNDNAERVYPGALNQWFAIAPDNVNAAAPSYAQAASLPSRGQIASLPSGVINPALLQEHQSPRPPPVAISMRSTQPMQSAPVPAPVPAERRPANMRRSISKNTSAPSMSRSSTSTWPCGRCGRQCTSQSDLR
ncbi:hypothetical protein EJ06DRAFT_274742 [Trichodelitschia bisporula]|uniref:Uncharacterized protein n=1 Tax=Trichodelitschia bisporula TaxID=703511 RepID=A0A6G1I4Z3_9PEZI|nr:hypothetical protein EJ06DRAFT_274742 [Trichodelitschia bisporula]